MAEKKTKTKEENTSKKNIFTDVKDETKIFNEKEISDGKGMGVLSYILPFIPYFAEKNNKYVQYHAKQGMNLLIISIAYSIIYSILTSIIKVQSADCGIGGYYGELIKAFGTSCKITPWWVTWPLSLIGLSITALCVIGIINVCNGKAKELPIVNKIKIFK